MILASVAAAQSWVPPGTFASPWEPQAVGAVELFRMDGGGAEWLVVRQSGRTLEGGAALAAAAAVPQADALLLARISCATVSPGIVGTRPWTAPLPSVDDELESFASAPAIEARELRYWLVDEGDLLELVVSLQDGAVKSRRSASELLRLRRERAERYESSFSQARHATSAARAASALQAMVESGDVRVPSGLTEFARHHSMPSARALALRLLEEHRGADSLEVLVAASSDSDAEVRIAAIRLLDEQGAAGRAAIEAAREDGEVSVREAAEAALAP